jgi:8-oxo-dGTP diphosphatase
MSRMNAEAEGDTDDRLLIGEVHPHQGLGQLSEVAIMQTRRGLGALPLEYAVSDLAALGEEAFLRALEARLRGGLRLLQLREKQLDAENWCRLARLVAASCREFGARLLLNGDAALAAQLGTGVHLSSSQLMAAKSRPDLEWVGASCHNPAELGRAVELGLDLVVLSPVLPTTSHPGAETVGWPRFAAWVADYPLPVFALGGLSLDDLETARAHGAYGVALKSQAWRSGVHAP